jgi:hypothetical protein
MKRASVIFCAVLAGCATAPVVERWPAHAIDQQAWWIARVEINATADETRSLESRRQIFKCLARTEDPAVVEALIDSLGDQRICDPAAGSYCSENGDDTFPCQVGWKCDEILQGIFGLSSLGDKPSGPFKPWREWLDDRAGKSIAEIYNEVTAWVRSRRGWPPAKSDQGAR